MRDYGFLDSTSLWVLPLALIAVILLLRSQERSIVALHRSFGSFVSASKWRIFLPCLVLLLAGLAATRPYVGRHSVTVRGSGRDIFLLIDVSLSMFARDVPPSRMEAAKRKAHDILTYVQNHSPEDRLGIILFAGDAYVFCPLTPDYGVVNEFLQNIGPDLISSRGSSLLRALTVSNEALLESNAAQPKLIIISDGEDLESQRADVKRLLEQMKGQSLFLGIGGTEGVPIPLPEGGYLNTAQNQMVTTRLNESDLKQLFTGPPHEYRRASLLDNDFAPFLKPEKISYRDTDDSSAASQREITTYGEVGPFLLAASLLLILVAALSGQARLLLALSLVIFTARAQAQIDADILNDSPAWQGNIEYQKGDYQKAFELFLKAQEETPNDPRVLQSLGSAAFKLGRLKEAERAFETMEQQASTLEQRFDAPYNLGNSLLAEKKFQRAIEAYDRALARVPQEPRALQNRMIAETLLKKEQAKEKEQSSQQSSQKSSEENSSSSSSSSSESSPQQNQSSSENSSSQESPESAASSASSNSSSRESEDREQSEDSSLAQSEQSSAGDSSQQKNSTASSPAPSERQSSAESAHGETAEGNPTPIDTVPLSEREAHDWLKALPESPLLMQRLNKQQRKPRGGQYW